MMKQMKVVFYIPREPVAPAMRLQDALVGTFTGITVVQGVGSWRSPKGVLCQEGVHVITLFCTDATYNRDEVRYLAMQYMREAYQECVLYEINGEPFFIDNERKL